MAEQVIKRSAFDSSEARAAALANPFAAFNLGSAPPDIQEDTLMPQRARNDYRPVPGSKPALAIAALATGPKTAEELGVVMNTEWVAANLKDALASGAVVKVRRGVWALPGSSLGERPEAAVAPASEPIPLAEPEAVEEAPSFFCAMYSTGELHLQFGEEQMMLPRDCTKQLTRYFELMVHEGRIEIPTGEPN